MTQAQSIYRELLPLESEIAAVYEILVRCGRVTETVTHWGERWFKFEDGSSVIFGKFLGPYVMA